MSEMADEAKQAVEAARKDVALAASKVATIGSHAARTAMLREPEVALPWVADLRGAVNDLRDALEELVRVTRS